jgi:hypothetical protein
MSHRYEFTRAAGDKSLILIFAEGTFESLPFEVRLTAPWTGFGYGNVAELKSAERRALLDAGYAIIRDAAAANVAIMHARRAADVAADTGLLQAA